MCTYPWELSAADSLVWTGNNSRTFKTVIWMCGYPLDLDFASKLVCASQNSSEFNLTVERSLIIVILMVIPTTAHYYILKHTTQYYTLLVSITIHYTSTYQKHAILKFPQSYNFL